MITAFVVWWIWAGVTSDVRTASWGAAFWPVAVPAALIAWPARVLYLRIRKCSTRSTSSSAS